MTRKEKVYQLDKKARAKELLNLARKNKHCCGHDEPAGNSSISPMRKGTVQDNQKLLGIKSKKQEQQISTVLREDIKNLKIIKQQMSLERNAMKSENIPKIFKKAMELHQQEMFDIHNQVMDMKREIVSNQLDLK